MAGPKTNDLDGAPAPEARRPSDLDALEAVVRLAQVPEKRHAQFVEALRNLIADAHRHAASTRPNRPTSKPLVARLAEREANLASLLAEVQGLFEFHADPVEDIVATEVAVAFTRQNPHADRAHALLEEGLLSFARVLVEARARLVALYPAEGRPRGSDGFAGGRRFVERLLLKAMAYGSGLPFSNDGGVAVGSAVEALEHLEPLLPSAFLPPAGGARLRRLMETARRSARRVPRNLPSSG